MMAKLPWLVTLALTAAIAPARAGGPLIKPPAGWHSNPEHATELGQSFVATTPGETFAVEAYGVDGSAISLLAFRRTVPAGSELGRLARLAVDDLRDNPRHAKLAGGNAHEDAWKLDVDAAQKAIVATLSWSQVEPRLVAHLRRVLVSDGSKLVEVTGECIDLAAKPAAIDACRAALASIDPGVALDARVAIALPDAAEPAAATDKRQAPSMTAGLDDGSVRLPPTAIAIDPPAPDRRPMYVGAGIVVLAFLFWWNRKHREQIERAERRAERLDGRQRQRRRRDRDDADADADDLHAAARGDAANDPDDLDVNSRDPS